MIAISESTPGPIGINMATFAGYKVAGILGGIIATWRNSSFNHYNRINCPLLYEI